eukprot:CAMPEP_0172508102 /NCGR_PEP_ID=MMETSP1066-20121228/209202_1 /TAXON_ID=671091 /ORGANISM="Coscinodiscus wailesii, Strain CCMP2513" /LENGTH=560 /DNA_ID=CAMNT_0013285931 /DNA_START=466 /DNA_END=2148 /DNA_ORIENTATION=+
MTVSDFTRECHIFQEGGRAIVVMRDPLESVVSRYLYEMKMLGRPADDFGGWCRETAERHKEADKYFFDEQMRGMLEGTPCHAEFFKWVQWYNNAFEMAKELKMDLHVMHHDDYKSAFKETVAGLVDFLGRRGEVNTNANINFATLDPNLFYTDTEKSRIGQFIEYMALERTRIETMRYIESLTHTQHNTGGGETGGVVKSDSQSTKLQGWKYRHENFPRNGWCQEPAEEYTINEKKEKGLLFVRVPKAASSTILGVALHIAHHVGEKNLPSKRACSVSGNHWSSIVLERPYLNSIQTNGQSFLWAWIRDPETRVVSNAFFSHVSRRGMKPTDSNIIGMLRANNYQLDFLNLDVNGRVIVETAQPPWKRGNKNKALRLSEDQFETELPKYIDQVLETYDFIGLVERMDESLVALRLLMGLEATDILYVNAKSAGGYDDGSFKKKCYKIKKSFISPAVREFLDSHQLQTGIVGDRMLHEAVSRKLDATIEELGVDRFQAALGEHKFLMNKAKEECAHKIIFPCSEKGVRQKEESALNCYRADAGCGYPCLNDIAKEYSSGWN